MSLPSRQLLRTPPGPREPPQTPDRRDARASYYNSEYSNRERLEKIHHNHASLNFFFFARTGSTLRQRDGQLQARRLLAATALFHLPFLDVFNDDWG